MKPQIFLILIINSRLNRIFDIDANSVFKRVFYQRGKLFIKV